MSVDYGPVGALVGVIRGVEVRLASVSVRDGALHVLLRATSSPETERMDAEFEAHLSRWGEAVDLRGAAAAGEPPAMPGSCLSVFDVRPTDARGIDYPFIERAVAGSGAEWDDSWTFGCPGPPVAEVEIAVSRQDRAGVARCEVSARPGERAILDT